MKTKIIVLGSYKMNLTNNFQILLKAINHYTNIYILINEHIKKLLIYQKIKIHF